MVEFSFYKLLFIVLVTYEEKKPTDVFSTKRKKKIQSNYERQFDGTML